MPETAEVFAADGGSQKPRTKKSIWTNKDAPSTRTEDHLDASGRSVAGQRPRSRACFSALSPSDDTLTCSRALRQSWSCVSTDSLVASGGVRDVRKSKGVLELSLIHI